MKIAVLLGGVGFDSQKRIIKGVLENAIPAGDNVYIFTCDAWGYKARFHYEEGEYNIYQLPDFTQYDGVIINSDTIHDLEASKELIHRIKEAHIPCISLNEQWENSCCLQMENETGIRAIAEHLIEVHHAKTIYFVSGPADNEDAKQRLNAYKETLKQHNLSWQEEDILYGDYTYQGGILAAKQYLHSGKAMPDAIMAANDETAIGLILTLEEAGLHVPEDIIVTGYDNSSIADLNYTSLTTVQRGEFEAGKKAYQKLVQIVKDKQKITGEIIYGRPVFAQSCGCGCDKKRNYSHKQLQKMYIEMTVDLCQNLERTKDFATEFTGLNHFGDLTESLKRYIKQLNPEYFYLCMCGSLENYYAELDYMAEGKERRRNVSVYTDEIYVPVAYEQGEFCSYGGFDKKYLLPPASKAEKEGNYYVIMPLHYRDYCFGYCVVGNYQKIIQERFFHLFVMNLNNALETVRKQDTMQALLKHMNRVWVYDELTGVYNRVGLRNHAPELLMNAQKEKQPVAVVFIDIDKLKKVNDTYGHEEGDFYIKTIAGILEENSRLNELVIRYGGDEFIILLSGYEEADLQQYIDKIQTAINHCNEEYKKEYRIDASIGYYIEKEVDKTNLEKIIELADQNMYAVKQQKKQKEAESGKTADRR